MAGGFPVPWPFPWSRASPTSALSQTRRRHGAAALAVADDESHADAVWSDAAKAYAQYGDRLPPIRQSRLYLVVGISEVALPSEPGPTLAVIYPPEFTWILDVGLDAFVAGVVSWEPVAYGDPGFPEKRPITLRSINGLSPDAIVFPNVAGSLIVGIREGTAPDEAKTELEGAGLKNVEVHGFFATAECKPFHEASTCRALEASLAFVKYAEQNSIQRIIDFSPGWFAKRLL